jgi:hypothetical protein
MAVTVRVLPTRIAVRHCSWSADHSFQEHNGKLKVALGRQTEILQPPPGKDIDQQMIVDLRRMLTAAASHPATEDALA